MLKKLSKWIAKSSFDDVAIEFALLGCYTLKYVYGIDITENNPLLVYTVCIMQKTVVTNCWKSSPFCQNVRLANQKCEKTA